MNRFERSTAPSRCAGVAMQVLAVVVPLLLLVPQRAEASPSSAGAPVAPVASVS